MNILKVKNKKEKQWNEVGTFARAGCYSTCTEHYFTVELDLEEFNYTVNMPKKEYKGE